MSPILRKTAAWFACLIIGAWAQGQIPTSKPSPDPAARRDERDSITVSATLIANARNPASQRHEAVPAVLWLKPIGESTSTTSPPQASSHYTLLQKDKRFSPHLLVVPPGSKVVFPNQDPFFHNVFSLFDGRRFDLGLYEAGKTREVTFSREGVSYIFCNIHPEMSAVVVVLSSPFYSIADASGRFVVPGVPAGEYEMHIWAEGVPQATQTNWIRRVSISPAGRNLGTFSATLDRDPPHSNKFGRPYDTAPPPQY